MELRKILKLFIAYRCHLALINDKWYYKWIWLYLPTWRWWLLKYNYSEFKDRYTNFRNYDNEPKYSRKQLWKINGYKYELKNWYLIKLNRNLEWYEDTLQTTFYYD